MITYVTELADFSSIAINQMSMGKYNSKQYEHIQSLNKIIKETVGINQTQTNATIL